MGSPFSSSGHVRTMQPRTLSLMRERNRYEPSDTEAEWEESPWKESDDDNVVHGLARIKITGSRFDGNGNSSIPARAPRIRQNASTFRPHLSARPDCAFSRSEQRRTSHRTENYDGSNRKFREDNDDGNISKASGASSFSRRSLSAPRKTFRERDVMIKKESQERLPMRSSTHHKRSPTGGQINEMLANVVVSKKGSNLVDATLESTDSIAPGDIFFSRDYDALAKQRNVFAGNGGTETPGSVTRTNSVSSKRVQMSSLLKQGANEVSPTEASTANSKFSVSRQSSNVSEYSERTNGSAVKFAMNRRKSQSDAWFACIRRGTCGGTKSPEKERAGSYEATVIEKAYVVESLRHFWADKHQPGSLIAFTFHKQEALLLKHLAADEIPHVLFKGPPGSGKKSLTMALLREIYGEPVRKVSHDLRCFHIKESAQMEVVVPISSSPHHVELNVSSEQNAMYALMSLVKQISADYAVVREISNVNAKADYKIMVLYEVDKVPNNIQHLIKWIMDCYSDACKLILCCESDEDILGSVKGRCKVIDVEALDIHEIREVLIQIADKEHFELSMSFATRVANKSKGNLRRAIMALEACRANNYPFVDDQPIPVGWEEVLEQLAAGILADPSNNRLFLVRGKIQTLLQDYVPPKLILLKLVKQFLKGVAASSQRELYYWHAYYEKRLPPGTSSLLKLEEFIAKFMSIHRRNHSHH